MKHHVLFQISLKRCAMAVLQKSCAQNWHWSLIGGLLRRNLFAWSYFHDLPVKASLCWATRSLQEATCPVWTILFRKHWSLKWVRSFRLVVHCRLGSYVTAFRRWWHWCWRNRICLLIIEDDQYHLAEQDLFSYCVIDIAYHQKVKRLNFDG